MGCVMGINRKGEKTTPQSQKGLSFQTQNQGFLELSYLFSFFVNPAKEKCERGETVTTLWHKTQCNKPNQKKKRNNYPQKSSALFFSSSTLRFLTTPS